MIDIENDVFNYVAIHLREKHPSIYLTGEYVLSPPKFPCISLIEVDNQIYRNGRTTDNTENFVQLMYEINVYTNKVVGKKSEAKQLLSEIDNMFNRLGFTRMTATPIPNLNDNTIYRIVARYRAIANENKQIFRR